MRIKFKKARTEYTGRTCIIVIDIFDLSVGLIVDSVSEVMNIDDESISPPLDERTGIENKYLRGIGKIADSVKLLLDCEMLISNETEIQKVTKE